MFININNIIYIIPKFTNEVDEYYNTRCSWIKNNNPNSLEDFNKNLILSKYIYNQLMYKCQYSNFNVKGKTIE